MSRSLQTTREVIRDLKKPFKVVVGVVVVGVSFYVLHSAVTEHDADAKSLLKFGGILLAVAVGASIAGWLLRLVYKFVYERLPGFWRRLMGGLAAVVSGLGFGLLGYLIGVFWLQDDMQKVMGLAAFGVVFLVHSFREGYRQAGTDE